MKKLGLDTVSEFKNGVIVESVNQALEDVVRDLKDRPQISAAREVTLTIKIKPGEISGGILETVSTSFHIKSKIPVKETSAHEMSVVGGRDGDRLMFNPASPDNPRQATLDQEAERKKNDDK